MTCTAMGLIVVGDELLSGRRQDRHLAHAISVLGQRGMRVAWCRIVGDDSAGLTGTLQQTRLGPEPVLSFGGIGSTPDDRTRAAAASAFGVDLELHRQAVELIEQQFGEQAYPHRIRMAELPRGCRLIPNPYNGIPGFSLDHHHFFPGFPEMAWPMLDWVLETCYPACGQLSIEAAVRVRDVRESELCDLMESLARRHTGASLFSLPHLGSQRYVELGFRGEAAAVQPAVRDLEEALGRLGMKFDPVR